MNGTSAPTNHLASAGHDGNTIGALLAPFIIVGAEFQRSWPSGTSLIYLVVCIPLLGIWLAHLSGWARAPYFAGLAIDLSIYTLLVASLGAHFGLAEQPAKALASTLLFWAPLIAAWWAWRYRDVSIKFVMMASLLFLILAWQFANSWQRFHEHLILAACLTLLVRVIANNASESRNNSGHDPVSGLTSAAYFEAELAHLSAIADRYQIPFSLVGCRIPAETAAQTPKQLSDYADAISNRLRASDTACQWDKATYLILLPNTDEDHAQAVAHNIRNALAALAPDAGTVSPAAIACIQHAYCEDPMSTLNALEQKLPAPQN